MQNIRAEVVLSTTDLTGDLVFFADRLGMRMAEIFPADDPREAVFTGHGLRMRLQRGGAGAGVLRILADDPVLIAGGADVLVAPGGTRVEIAPLAPPVVMPPLVHEFAVRRIADNAPWIVGRAGMHYRDLVPTRLGGAMIASHIRIPGGGPVPDMVHFHSVGFQLIHCYRGWVDLVYEDQGPPFRLEAGNCVIQPPEIRHRVLFASDGVEVIEIGVPAEHITTIDHEMPLPTPSYNPDRVFGGQRFVHHRAADAVWQPHRLPGFDARDTGIAAHTDGVAGVHVARAARGRVGIGAPGGWAMHDSDILFAFVTEGSATLESDAAPPVTLSAGDAFCIPPRMRTRLGAAAADFEMLEVSLPGKFTTTLETGNGA